MSFMSMMGYDQPVGNVCVNLNGWVLCNLLIVVGTAAILIAVLLFLLVKINHHLKKLEEHVAEIRRMGRSFSLSNKYIGMEDKE